jgi:dTDP-4-dehydrorhamnose reductase
VVQRALEMGVPLKTAPDAVLAITTDGYPTPAKRPASSRLDTSRIRSVFGVPLPDWKIGVEAVLAQLVKEMRT